MGLGEIVLVPIASADAYNLLHLAHKKMDMINDESIIRIVVSHHDRCADHNVGGLGTE